MEPNEINNIEETQVASFLKNLSIRLKSPIVWFSLAFKVVGILLLMGVIDTDMGEIINRVLAGLLFAATGYSDLNNPTNREGF